MRPFSIADKWIDSVPGPSHPSLPNDTYTHWSKAGNSVVEASPHDLYTPPDVYGPGSGYTLDNDLGVQKVIKMGTDSQIDKLQGGWYFIVDLPEADGTFGVGGSNYRQNIATCYGNSVSIGQYLPVESGAKVGPTKQGTDDLIAKDPGATWDPVVKAVRNSCAPTCAPFSPRIVPIAVFDIEDFQKRELQNTTSPMCPTGGQCVKVVNILGFFVESVSNGGDVTGYFTRVPGTFLSGKPTVGGVGAFLTNIQLIR
jgi:hypothetical protein